MFEEINEYDNVHIRKIIYESQGKPKGLSYEEFAEELDIIVNDMYQESLKINKFRKEYYKRHKHCPRCGFTGHTSTLAAFVIHPDNLEAYKDENDCVCSNCGDRHTTHDRV